MVAHACLVLDLCPTLSRGRPRDRGAGADSLWGDDGEEILVGYDSTANAVKLVDPATIDVHGFQ